MSHLPKVLHALSRLFEYPTEQTSESAELLYVLLQDEVPEAATCIAQFGQFLEQNAPTTAEEKFTELFDINPACALEVGWHLFGEEYARGMFLVRLREEMRKHELSESSELPDHITHVLAVVAAMPEEEAIRFVKACVQPAVEKMLQAVSKQESPYVDVVRGLSLILKHVWGEPSSDVAFETAEGGNRPFEGDPLRDYPAAHVMAGCGSACGEPLDLVELQLPGTHPSPTAASVDSHSSFPVTEPT